MSYIFLQGQEAAFSEVFCWDISQFAPSKLSHTAVKSSYSDKETESCLGSPSGTMLKHSTVNRGEGSQTLSAAGSHVPTSLVQTRTDKGHPANIPACGEKWKGSLAKYDRVSCSWKTRQCSLFEDSETFSADWPRWGIMLHGECSAVMMPGCFTAESDSGLLPTPLTNPSKRTLDSSGRSVSSKGQRYGVSLYQLAGGQPCPQFQEWLMGWITGWTETKPLAMARYRLWRLAHGKF